MNWWLSIREFRRKIFGWSFIALGVLGLVYLFMLGMAQ